MLLTATQLSLFERSQLEQHEAVIERGLQTFVEVGNALAAIRDGKLYREEFGTFEDYCRDRWGFTYEYARLTMRAARVVTNLEENPTIVGFLPATESQARPLTRLEPDAQAAAWREAVETAPNGKVTAAHVEEVVQRYEEPRPAPHVSHNSGENEWYTPSEYIEAARAVMGDIDTDPASSATANQTVKAARYFTAQVDGLRQKWEGRVWMNPPYAQPLIGQFCAKLKQEVEQGAVFEAITLTNNATETGWFNDLLSVASAVCFVRGRIRFVDPQGNASGAPLQGQAICYIGPSVDQFAREFGRFGKVLYG